MQLECNGKILDLSLPAIMGVVNVTPDSFSDGGQFYKETDAIRQGIRLAEQGADILDIGGESTRPNATGVSVEDELNRVIPVIRMLQREVSIPISVDTSNPEVMRQAVDAGAGMINDVRALSRSGALKTAVACGVPVCLMHMQGTPGSMQQNPRYDDVVTDVLAFLKDKKAQTMEAGIPEDRILLDPGFGFGKTYDHNLALLRGLSRFRVLNSPILVGLSRKSMLQKILNKPVDERLYGSLALAALAIREGASIVRVHDVAETWDVRQVCQAFLDQPGGS